jgi:general secretion pathway protein D
MIRHIYILTIFLITSLPIFSQNPEVPAIQDVAPADNELLIKEKIESTDFSGNDLASLYTKYTDRRVIVSSSAAKASFAFNLDASPKNPLTYTQAAEILKKTAHIEGFIFVPDTTDPNLDYLTISSANKGIGLSYPVFIDTDTLPDSNAVITYFMKLDHIKPEEVVRTFQQIVGQFGAYGSITASTNTSSVIITENISLIRRLIDIKAQIDKPSSTVVTRFINVKNADVTELAATLNEMLGNQQQTNRTAGIQRAPQPNIAVEGIPNIPLSDASGGSTAGEETPMQIIPDPRTNSIVFMGRDVDRLFVESLISQFDRESDHRNSYSRKLEFLAVADFLPIAGDALTRAFSGTGSGSQGSQGGQSGLGGQGGQSNRSQTNDNRNASNSSLGGLGGSSGSGGSSRSDALQDPEVSSAPVSLLVGRTLLIADNISNSVHVQGPPTSIEIINNLLDNLDVKADQVMISTVFGQLSLDDTVSTGVDWLRAFRGNDDGGIGFSNIGGEGETAKDPTGLINPITGIAAGSFPNQTGLSLYGKIGNSLAAYVNLLSTRDDFTVLSRPSIYTANNRKGTISSGRRIAIPTNSNQFSGGGVSTNIEYRDVVLKLEVIPLVNSDNEITLEIALLSDDVVATSLIEGVGPVPIIGTRELLTTVTVPNNQTIILGGLITSNDTENVTGIPILSDIPGIGRLFSTKTNSVEREELMIFIQPSIVNSKKTLDNVQSDMDRRYDVSDPARTFGDGGVLPSLESPIEPANTTKDPANSSTNKHTPTRPIHKR